MKTIQLLAFFMCFAGTCFSQKLENPFKQQIDLNLPAPEINTPIWKRNETSLIFVTTEQNKQNLQTTLPYIPAYAGPSGRFKDKTQLGESLFHATGALLNALH